MHKTTPPRRTKLSRASAETTDPIADKLLRYDDRPRELRKVTRRNHCRIVSQLFPASPAARLADHLPRGTTNYVEIEFVACRFVLRRRQIVRLPALWLRRGIVSETVGHRLTGRILISTAYLTSTTGSFAKCTTFAATDPIKRLPTAPMPRVPITIKSHCHSRAASTMD